MHMGVSIPQAVSAVATIQEIREKYEGKKSFNTASGKRRCNVNEDGTCPTEGCVSIPQAVSAVATEGKEAWKEASVSFQYRKR